MSDVTKGSAEAEMSWVEAVCAANMGVQSVYKKARIVAFALCGKEPPICKEQRVVNVETMAAFELAETAGVSSLAHVAVIDECLAMIMRRLPASTLKMAESAVDRPTAAAGDRTDSRTHEYQLASANARR